MKILAIDYGEKRIGLAVGDADSKIAFPRGIINNSPKAYKEINNFCLKETIEKVVVGLPLSLSGEDSAQTKEVRRFINQLKDELDIEVKSLDERLTTVQAHKMFPEKEYIDDASAALLLEQYFNHQE